MKGLKWRVVQSHKPGSNEATLLQVSSELSTHIHHNIEGCFKVQTHLLHQRMRARDEMLFCHWLEVTSRERTLHNKLLYVNCVSYSHTNVSYGPQANITFEAFENRPLLSTSQNRLRNNFQNMRNIRWRSARVKCVMCQCFVVVSRYFMNVSILGELCQLMRLRSKSGDAISTAWIARINRLDDSYQQNMNSYQQLSEVSRRRVTYNNNGNVSHKGTSIKVCARNDLKRSGMTRKTHSQYVCVYEHTSVYLLTKNFQ